MIEVKNLVKKYGNHLAVDHLNFTVEKGQIYGFLGPNGAGKSTTMNIITGYISATEGQVIVNGHDIFEEPEKAKQAIGYLPELPPLYMDMTPREYLWFAAELKKIPKNERNKMIEEVVELTKLTSVQERLIKNLSKGYRQRVGLAQAILGYPEIIILDEPTVGLDPKQIIEIRDLIKRLSKKHTVILSSHILSEVSAICDYVMIISNGRLVASDTPEHLGELMSGSNTIELTVKGKTEKIKGILNRIEEICSYHITKSMESGCKEVKIQTKKQADIREDLFFAFANENSPILMMNSTKVSLEDVFLELTGEKQKQNKNEIQVEDDMEENLQESLQEKIEMNVKEGK